MPRTLSLTVCALIVMSGCNPLVSTPATSSAFHPGVTQVTLPNIPMTLSSVSVPSAGTTVVVEIGAVETAPLLPSTGVSGFTVEVNGSAVAVNSAAVTANTEVTLTLAAAIASTDTVTVTYASGNLTDSSSPAQVLTGFTDQAVTNSSIWDRDALTYFANIATHGGTISATSQGYVNTFVKGMKTEACGLK